MKQVQNNIKKAFALTSLVGATLLSSNNGNPRMVTLSRQCNAAMRVFSVKAGRREYYTISEQINKLWSDIATRHNNTLDIDEIELFIELLLNLMPKSDMRKFLGFTFTTKNKIRDERKSEILMTVLDVDSCLNELFGTVATANRDSLANVLVKPIKAKKAPVQRDVGVEPRLKKLRKRIAYAKQKVRNG